MNRCGLMHILSIINCEMNNCGMQVILLVYFILVIFVSFSAAADEDTIAQISLITESDDITKPFYIGLYFEMEPDWYIYWENPGDAGIPVDVQWELPDGYSISELIYPTPERFDTQGLISFGFKDEALLFAKVTPPSSQTGNHEQIISADVSWMVCKESCILEEGTAELDLLNAEPTPGLFDKYKNKLPEPLAHSSTRVSTVESLKRDGRFYISIHLEGDPVADFFPGPVEDFILSHKDIEISDHKISYTLRPYSDTTVVEEVSGLLFIDDVAFHFNEPVSVLD